MLDDWREPASLEAAHDEQFRLTAEIQEIQAQLGDRQKKHSYPDLDQYYVWRKGAIWAMTNRLQKLRQVKKWIRTHQPANTLGGNDDRTC